MKAEENLVDNWLKQSVKREIGFRLAAWSLFTLVAFYISFKEPTFVLSNYAIQFIHKIHDQLNFIWKFLFYLMLIAFFFKDMRYDAPDEWGGNNIKSKAGMVLTKLTYELLLWTGGASTALLVISAYSLPTLLFITPNTTNQDRVLTILAISFTAILTMATVSFYYYLRRDKPLISKPTIPYVSIRMVYAIILIGSFVIIK